MKRENAKEASLRTLMIAGLNGDTAAYRALLSGLSGHLRAYYRGKLVRAGRGTEEAEDLVQEALIAVHTRRHTYDPTQLLTPWVYAIARYKLIDHLRQSQSRLTNVPIEDASEIIAACIVALGIRPDLDNTGAFGFLLVKMGFGVVVTVLGW